MKKWFSVWLSLFLAAGALPSPSSAAGFPDAGSSRFSEEIQFLLDEGVLTGFSNGQFSPKSGVTRGQAAIMLGRALGYTGERKKTPFRDVPASGALSGYVAAAVEAGVISGYPDGTYRPDQPVTRAEMALFLYRAFDLGYEGEPVYFLDVGQSMNAHEAIGQLSAWGVAAGYGSHTFKPSETLTREQFAAFVARAMNPAAFAAGPDKVEVAFLDVGRGDAVYLEYADGRAVLIDAGPDAEQISRALDEIGARNIDTLIVTHPGPGHIGGAAWVLEHHEVNRVYDSGLTSDTVAFAAYQKALAESGAAVETVKTGDSLSLDPAAVSLDVLYADSKAAELDGGGMVLKLTSGIWDFLLAGDAAPDVQQHLVDKYELEAKILKVPAHGEKSHYTYPFVDEVNPRMSVLSHGGGADAAVVGDLRAGGSDIYDTHVQGTVIYVISNKFMEINVPYHLYGYGQLVPDIRFELKDLEEEVVTLTNYDRVNADMTGFQLVSVTGGEVYTFPDGFILRSGRSVRITSGPGAVHSPPESLKWTEASVWENSGDPAKLYEPGNFLLVETP